MNTMPKERVELAMDVMRRKKIVRRSVLKKILKLDDVFDSLITHLLRENLIVSCSEGGASMLYFKATADFLGIVNTVNVARYNGHMNTPRHNSHVKLASKVSFMMCSK